MVRGQKLLRPLSLRLTVLVAVFTAASTVSPGAVRGEVDPYASDPQPLTVQQCAQCHPRQFGNLKQEGGKHRFACQDCHEVFHAYNPLRNNYAELMPQCSACHDQPHGAKIVDCLSCHSNPHAPLRVKATKQLGGLCGNCHLGQAGELKQFPSAHSKVECQSCHHEKHGFIPDCFECHEPHFAGEAVAECSACHPVHKPLETTFSLKDNPAVCNSCHDTVFAKWQSTKSKHGKVNCTVCHKGHGKIPECRDCHTPPHGEKLLQMFPNCLTCHLDVHNMPVKQKKQ